MRVGILGGGQLGRMLSLAAHPLGLEPLVLEPKPECPAAAVARTLGAGFLEPAALEELAGCDVVTYETETIPAEALRILGARAPIRPGESALVACSDRLLEKQLLGGLGIPTAPHRAVDSETSLREAVVELGLPALLKTRRFGYDGRGQRLLREPSDLAPAWRELAGQPLLLEGWVPFDREVSCLAVRGTDGQVRHWAATENRHVGGILRISRAPAPGLDDVTERRLQGWMQALLERLDYVGVIAVELFVRGEEWIANEIACRVHNSGHWTLDGAVTSQFENHLRAVAGLPLGSTRLREPTAMLNWIGRLPPLETLLAHPGLRMHDYAKTPAPDRKLGHANLSAPTASELEERLSALVRELGQPELEAALGSGAARL